MKSREWTKLSAASGPLGGGTREELGRESLSAINEDRFWIARLGSLTAECKGCSPGAFAVRRCGPHSAPTDPRHWHGPPLRAEVTEHSALADGASDPGAQRADFPPTARRTILFLRLRLAPGLRQPFTASASATLPSGAASERTSASSERRVLPSGIERKASSSSRSSGPGPAGLRRRARVLRPLGQLLEEVLDGHVQHSGKNVEASRADPICPFLVLLDLTEGETELPSQPSLAQAERLAKLAHPLPDVGVDLVRTHMHSLICSLATVCRSA